MIFIFLLTASVAYDASVCEASGDMRWYMLHATALILMAGSWKHMIESRIPAIVWMVVLLAAWSAVSLIWTINPWSSWWELKHVAGYAVLFWFVYALRSERWYMALIWATALGAGFNILIGIAQVHGASNVVVDYFQQTAPPAGTLANKNLLGSYLVLTLPAILYLVISRRKVIARITAATLFTAGAAILFFIHSRASWIAALSAAVFFAVWMILKHRKRRVVTIVLVLISLIFSVRVIAPKGDSFSTRLAYDLNGLAMIKDRPWTGTGIGTFREAYPAYNHAVIKTPPSGFSATMRPKRMHNDVEQAFVELGIPGGMAYIVIFAMLLIMTWKTKSMMVLFLMTGIVGLSVNALMDFPMQLPMAPIVIWTFAGMIAGIHSLQIKKECTKVSIGWMIPILTAGTVAAGILIIHDDWSRWRSQQYLRVIATRVAESKFDERTNALLTEAMNYYSWDMMLQEYRALIISKTGERN